MAEERVPPPMEETPDFLADDDDDGDIFAATPKPKEKESPQTDDEITAHKTVGAATEDEVPASTKEESGDDPDDGEDLFASASAEPVSSVKVDEDDLFASAMGPPATAPVEATSVKPVAVVEKKSSDAGKAEDGEDQFNIEISITSPSKIGDGMSAYMVYQVNTVTNIPVYKKSQLKVTRRFSDFLGLHEKLVAKHRPVGVIVPKAPEKSTVGMAKVKMSKEETGSQDFIEKRRAALERYMNRTAAHPTLRMDPDFRDFLSMDADLPKASNTSALSAAGVMRLFGKVGDAVSKMSTNMTETDSWFEDKLQQVDNLEIQLKKLHESSEFLVSRRHALSQCSTAMAKACANVATVEEHTNLAQVMSKLAELEEKAQLIHEEQCDSDFFTLSELLKDYLSQISAVKDAFNERVKIYKMWKDAEAMLTRKREAKEKLKLQLKTDKITAAENECKEWEEKVEKGEKDFNRISENLKKEMIRFDRKRVKDFKANLINYLEKLLNNEEQLIEHWEGFLPEAKSIS